MVKGHMEDGKFHPHTQSKAVRKSRDQKLKTEGVKIKKERFKKIVDPSTLNDFILDLRIQKLQTTKADLDFAKKVEGFSTFEQINTALKDAEKEKKMRTDNPKTQSQLRDFVTRKFNKEIPSAKNNPFRDVNFRDIEKIGKNKWRFTISLTSGDDVAVKDVEGIGFKSTEIRDILDSRHATFEGDLGLG